MSFVVELFDINKELKNLYLENLDKIKSGSTPEINALRDKSIKDFEKIGIPTQKNEDYKYTLLSPSFNKKYDYHFQPSQVNLDVDSIFSCDVPDLNTDVAVLLNGWYFSDKEGLSEFENGVVIGSFAEAARKYPELFKKHYGKYATTDKDGLIALNTAFAQDGLFIHIPKGVVLEKPIQIINILLDEKDLMVQHRNLFILEEGSEAKIVVCDHTLSTNSFLTNSVTEIFAAKNSNLDFVRMQNEHNNSTQISSTFISQRANSNVTSNFISLHGGIIRNNIEVKLEEEGCENNIYGLYLTDKKQHISNHTVVEHNSANCFSRQKFKGVLDDDAIGAFNGKILVNRDAQKTTAFQTNNNILLTDTAKIYTKPQLVIYADDVKCSHGATVGSLNEEAMFYLRSRGIGRKEARLLLMYAFTDEVISEINIQSLRDRVQDLVDKRLRGDLSRCENCSIQCE